MARLLVFGCFPNNTRSVLGKVLTLTFVRIELLFDSGHGFCPFARRLVDRELHVTELADAEDWNILDAPNDPKFSPWHIDILRRQRRRSSPVDLKRHHYRNSRHGRLSFAERDSQGRNPLLYLSCNPCRSRRTVRPKGNSRNEAFVSPTSDHGGCSAARQHTGMER